jgi:hypothetical protein
VARWHRIRLAHWLRLPLLAAVAAVSIVALGLPGVSAGAATSAHPGSLGKPWQSPAQPKHRNGLAVLGQGSESSAAAQTARASARAKATGKPVVVTGLTTGTTTVTAEPNGTEVARDYVLPVRVRHGSGWIAVDKDLHRVAGGRLAPVAIPGDAVTFSDGDTSPMAVISASGTRLALSWPARLPAPVVSGASATYRNVFPGVDLVLTATSEEAGGFSEVLVVHTLAAARDPRLAHLALRVATSGTTALRSVAGGGLAAAMTGRRGSYVAAAPIMYDSSSVSPLARAARAAAASARRVGADLAAGGTGTRSSVAGPAGGARLAAVRATVSGGGTALMVTPDERMLTSSSTRFPVYIDPAFQAVTANGSLLGDVVQSDDDNGGAYDVNCTGPHYNDSSYPTMPVGYDNFQDGDCEYNDTDYALYEFSVPAGALGSQSVLLSAQFQAAEAYSSVCDASAVVTASLIGPIGSGTGWPGPAIDGRNVLTQDTVGPDPNSCGDTLDAGDTVAAPFNLLPDFQALLKTDWSGPDLALRLWETGSPSEDLHKQFTTDPALQLIYTETPNTPSDLEESATSTGTGSVGCDTSPSDPPWIGKTDSASGVYLDAVYGDPDGAAVQANIKYWDYTTSAAATTADDAISSVTTSDGESGWQLPASFTDDMTDGTVVAWQAQAETGSGSVGGTTYGPYSSAWSPACYFAVDPTDPNAPTVAAVGSTQDVAVGSTVSFTITQSAGDTAKEFVWGVDETPPTTGAIPSAQTCTTTAATAHCTEISSGVATLTITVTSPGPHELSVYEVDVAGNDSGTASGAPQGSNSAFSGAGDPSVSFTSAGSLQANFDAALTAGQSFDNTMISTAAGASGTANGDGGGDSLDESQLQDAGWEPGGHVTVDGTTFTLPDFGTSTSGPDNVLAANQTIGTGSSGAQGSALVVLATSTNGDVEPGGLATGQSDGVLASDATAPPVMGNVPVTGYGCDGTTSFNATTGCEPATGTISYATGCTEDGSTLSSASYTLTVPDWADGPTDIAALTLPDQDTSADQQAQSMKIYAFAVPLDPACTVTAVTLPDVAASVTGLTQAQPALHIFGLALRNTTTTTPEVGGAAPSSPDGQAWTAAFESPIEDAYLPPAGETFGDQTVRIDLAPNVSSAAGTADVRIRLSNPGFLSDDGTGPLVIGAATIAQSYYGYIPSQDPVPLTFGGSTSVTIPEGGDVYSDPLPLPFAITAGKPLLISLWIKNSSVPLLPMNSWASGANASLAPSSTPNETQDTSATPFSGSGSYFIGAVPVLTGLDVTTAAETIDGVSSPGDPTVVVAGDNVIDGFSSDAQPDALDIPSQRIAGQLASQGLAAGFGVVDAGVQSNKVVADGNAGGGVSLLARLDRDILTEPDVGTVVIDEGLQDVLSNDGSTAVQDNLEAAYGILASQLGAFGINVIIGDLTPCGGYSNSTVGDSCSTAVETVRETVNSYIDDAEVPPGGSAPPPCPAAFDAAVSASTSASPEVLQAAYDAGDHVNLTLGTTGGYAALAHAVAATGCIAPNANTPAP